MTMLNAAPAATTVPTGTTSAAAASASSPQPVPVAAQPQPVLVQPRPATSSDDRLPEVHLPGSSGADVTPGGPKSDTVTFPLDQFARRSGPDASFKTPSGVVTVHAVFQLDAKTRELSVAIVNEDGQLVRLIPPESVARMITAMATYRGR